MAQYTTTASRLGAYAGAIPHWLYFTPLRKHGREWSRLVIWSSGIGTLSAIARHRHRDLDVFALEAVPLRRNADEHSLPRPEALAHHLRPHLRHGGSHVGVQRHAVDGSVSACRGPRSGRGPGMPDGASRRFAAVQPAAFASRHPREALALLAALDVKELELTSFAGEPVYLATLARGETRIIPLERRATRRARPAADHRSRRGRRRRPTAAQRSACSSSTTGTTSIGAGSARSR